MVKPRLSALAAALFFWIGAATCTPTQIVSDEAQRVSSPESEPASSPDSQAASLAADVGPGPGSYRYIGSWGGPGQKPGQFDNPVGLASTPTGGLIVADTGNQRLQELSNTGAPIKVWAIGTLRPMHLGRTREGHLLVPIYLDDVVEVHHSDGSVGARFGGNWLDGPAAAAGLPDGRTVVVDFYHHQIHILSEAFEVVRTVGGKGHGAGRFTYPTDVEVAPDGTIWIADAYGHRLEAITSEGKVKQVMGAKGRGPGQFDVVAGISIGPDGRLYAADMNNDRVQVFGPDGRVLAILGLDGDGRARLKHPAEVIATDNRVFILDTGNHEIDVYDAP